jgi:hypothetical protein
MEREGKMIAYCGLDCSKCDGYIAAQSGDEKQIAEVAKKWAKIHNADVKPEHVTCDGCKSGKRMSFHCSTLCKVRKCAVQKKHDYCIECADYACGHLKVILDLAPEAKENLERMRK